MKRRLILGVILAVLLLLTGTRRLIMTTPPIALNPFAPTPAAAAFTATLPRADSNLPLAAAVTLCDRGESVTAEALLLELEKSNPSLTPYCDFLRGKARLVAGDTPAALELFGRVAATPGRAVARRARECMAQTRLKAGDAATAAADYLVLAEHQEAEAAAPWRLKAAGALARAGDTENAIALCRAVMSERLPPGLRMFAVAELNELSPTTDPEEIRQRADLSYAGGDFATAALMYQRLMAATGQTSDILLRYARSCERADDFRGALRAYDSLRRQHPNFATNDVLYHAGTCHQRVGEDAKAENCYLELLRRAPRSPWTDDVLFRLGNRHDRAEERAQALFYYRQLLRRYPRSQWADDAAWKIGFAAYEDGQFEEAAAAFTAALKRFPRSDYAPAMGYWRGRLLAERDPRAALDQYREVLRQTRDPYYRHLAADAYRRLGGRLEPGFLEKTKTRAENGELVEALSDLRAAGDLAHGPAQTRCIDEMKRLLERCPGWENLYGFSTATVDTVALARATADLAAGEPRSRRRARREGEPPPEAVLAEIELLAAAGAWELAADELLAWRLAGRLGPEQRLALARLFAEGGRFRNAIREAEVLLGDLGGGVYPPALPEVLGGLLYPRFYAPIVGAAAADQKIDERLVFAIIREESRFDARIVSWAGAQGLMQIMPATGRGVARSMGRNDFRVAELAEPSVNIALGARYLHQLLDNYDGRVFLAVAAYNAGPGNTDRWLRENALEDEALWIEKIPFKETRNYVKRVLGSFWTYRQLDGEPFVTQPLTLADLN